MDILPGIQGFADQNKPGSGLGQVLQGLGNLGASAAGWVFQFEPAATLGDDHQDRHSGTLGRKPMVHVQVTLTPAGSVVSLPLHGERRRRVSIPNRSNAALQDLIANTPNGIEGLTNNPVAQVVPCRDWTISHRRRWQTSTGLQRPTRTLQIRLPGGTNPISRAILGAGGSMESTPIGFGIDQSNKILRE